MAITIVGTPQALADSNGNDVTLTFSETPATGDYVIVFGGHTEAGAGSADPVTSGYSNIAEVVSPSSVQFGAWYKKMGGTPDTTVVCNGTGNSAHGSAWGCYVLRGADATTLLDVAATKTGPTTTGQPDCPSIDPTTSDCLILALMGRRNTDSSITGPSGYSNIIQATANDLVDMSICGGTKQLSGHAAEDPPATTGWLENSEPWGAITVAIRPASTAVTGTFASTLDGTTLAAEGDEEFVGAFASTLAGVTFEGDGDEEFSGEFAASLAGATFAGEGTYTEASAGNDWLQKARRRGRR